MIRELLRNFEQRMKTQILYSGRSLTAALWKLNGKNKTKELYPVEREKRLGIEH